MCLFVCVLVCCTCLPYHTISGILLFRFALLVRLFLRIAFWQTLRAMESFVSVKFANIYLSDLVFDDDDAEMIFSCSAAAICC